jgi:hypothetical protein
MKVNYLLTGKNVEFPTGFYKKRVREAGNLPMTLIACRRK